MKKIVITAGLLLFSALIGWRIWNINADVATVPTQVYAQNEWVPLEGAFQDTANENTDGYFVRVKSVQSKTYEELVREYGANVDYIEKDFRPKDVLDIEFEFKNENNIDGHIVLFLYFAEGDNFALNLNSDLWNLTVPQGDGQLGFALKENTSYSFHAPYVTPSLIDIDLSGKKLQVIVSRVPEKKVIEITVPKNE